ncbi:unnamed protein product [Phaeothamnion confervicola]
MRQPFSFLMKVLPHETSEPFYSDQTLDLSGNKISALPVLLVLLKLRTLRLDTNRLAALPDLSELADLRDLSAENNRLEGPSAVGPLPPSLTRLSLAHNALAGVPVSLIAAAAVGGANSSSGGRASDGGLPALAVLDLSGNRISVLPAMPGLPALAELTMDDNLLTGVGAEVTALMGLKRLSLRRNRIAATVPRAAAGGGGGGSGGREQSLCRELFEATAVEVLNLEGNPLDKPQLMAMEGVAAFLARREKLKNRNLQGGAALSLSVCGLD